MTTPQPRAGCPMYCKWPLDLFARAIVIGFLASASLGAQTVPQATNDSNSYSADATEIRGLTAQLHPPRFFGNWNVSAAPQAPDDSILRGRPLNLDLELRSRWNATFPLNWFCTTDNCEQSVVLDSTVAHHATHSLRIRVDSAVNPPFVGVQVRGVKSLKGSQLRVSGWVRTADLRGTTRIFVRLVRPDPAPAETLVVNGPTGTSPWTHVVLDAHIDSTFIRFGIFTLVKGVGTAWFDDLRVEVDGRAINNDAPIAPLPTAPELASLQRIARPLRSTDPRDSDDDLALLDTIVGDAQVIALGEATHGTSEFHSMSDRIIRHLVRTKGVSVVAMETDELAAAKLNRYVLTGEGDIEHARSGMYQIMRTREYAELFKWMRQYNSSKQGRLEVVGFDMFLPLHAIDSVEAFIRRSDPSYAPAAVQAYAAVRADFSKFPMNDTLYYLGDSVHAGWERGAKAVLEHIRTRRGEAPLGSDTLSVARAVHNADVAFQVLALYGSQANREGVYRDSCMAANLLWQLAHRRGVRVVMLAHYAHAGRDDGNKGGYLGGNMGGYLGRALGERYRPVMLTTNTGSYTASLRPFLRPRPLSPTPMDAGPPESIEGILHGLHIPMLLLDLRGPARDSLGSIVAARRPVRFAGGATMDWAFGNWVLAGSFDALIFIAGTHATTIIRCPDDLACTP